MNDDGLAMFLTNIGLGVYIDALHSNGYDSLEYMLYMARKDCELAHHLVRDAGLRIGHARVLRQKLLDVDMDGTCQSLLCEEDGEYGKLAQFAQDAETMAVSAIQFASAGQQGVLAHFYSEALMHVGGTSPSDALLAYRVARRARAECDGDVKDAASEAERATCDLLAWRCQVSAGLSSRRHFLDILRDAAGGRADQDLEERVLLAHAKTVAVRLPGVFLSNTKEAQIKRKKKVRRKHGWYRSQSSMQGQMASSPGLLAGMAPPAA
jgi:hypothetical protein